MSNGALARLAEIAGDPDEELSARLRALSDLREIRNPTAIESLKKLWDRARPGPDKVTWNWDPGAAERVIDVHIIWTLYVLGDETELDLIASLISQAGDILQGPDDELSNAVAVILAIGRSEPIRQLIDLVSDTEVQVVDNVVEALNQLQLPRPPVGGDVSSVARLADEHSFEIRTLKEEIETLQRLSQGSIQLSPGVREYIVANDYDREAVQRENVSLSEVIQDDLEMLEFDYYMENDQVMICTHTEAGQRWQDWWRQYGDQLVYQEDQSRFVLKGEG
ncbi:MAG: hypothetical protein ABII79_12115 [bacterium]